MDNTRDETSTFATMMVCIFCLIFSLSYPIIRGLYDIELMTRNYVGLFTAILFVTGIIVLNQELMLPKIMGKSKKIFISIALNFVVLALIPALLIVVWGNGEQVVARSGSSTDKMLLFVLFSVAVYLLAEAISTGIRNSISLDENNIDQINKDELDYKGKKIELFQFKLKSTQDLPDDKKLDFDIWLEPNKGIIFKVKYNRLGNWEYKLKNYE